MYKVCITATTVYIQIYVPVNPGVMAASFRDNGVRSRRVLIG